MKSVLPMALLGMLLAAAPICTRPVAMGSAIPAGEPGGAKDGRARLILLDDMGNEPDEVQQMTNINPFPLIETNSSL